MWPTKIIHKNENKKNPQNWDTQFKDMRYIVYYVSSDTGEENGEENKIVKRNNWRKTKYMQKDKIIICALVSNIYWCNKIWNTKY